MKFQLVIFTTILSFLSTVVSEELKVTSAYCTQYNSTLLNLKFDKASIDSLTDNQYLLKDFEQQILDEGSRLDYYIKYFHIARGFCYYDDPKDAEKPLDSFFDIPILDNDGNDIGERNDLKYAKTINCYYMYRQYLTPDSLSKIIEEKRPCRSNFISYFNTVLYFLRNEEKCPYPQSEDMVSLGDRETIYNAREKYLSELYELYLNEIQFNDNCLDLENEEVINCGKYLFLLTNLIFFISNN
ncbi:hypothetical protein PIROE2DRAFT_16448 [Piromyces sp. E2]|nr:hypothetical protein PIROE2DRAFT_16448 [Piromyces sp. E2]|eukprot:OUM58301.1 hypothetical protein PIROE2DRAFT_16448 [Piromyces sp. E2]